MSTAIRGYLRHQTTWRDLRIELDVVRTVNYSLAHCGRPIVTRLTVRNIAAHPSPKTTLCLEVPGYTISHGIVVPGLNPGTEQVLTDIVPEFRIEALETLHEPARATGVLLAAEAPILEFPLWVLTHNQWSTEEAHIPALASFVLAEHPLVKQLVIDAREHLANAAGQESATFHSVLHSDRPDRIEVVVGALYECLRHDWRLHYAHEPPSDELTAAQRIRLPHDVLQDLTRRRGTGTCIDFTLLLAACLEQIGAEPLVVAMASTHDLGHVLLACRRTNTGGSRNAVHWDRTALANCTVVECTGVAEKPRDDGRLRTFKFDEALTTAKDNLKHYQFLFAVDIAGTRRLGIGRLPFSGEPRPSATVSAAILQAHLLASTFGSQGVETTHLLLALTKTKDGLMPSVWEAAGATPGTVAAVIQERFKILGGKRGEAPGKTQNFIRAERDATWMAKDAGSPLILEEHLVNSLLATRSIALDRTLVRLHFDRDVLSKVARQVCGDTAGSPSAHSCFPEFSSSA